MMREQKILDWYQKEIEKDNIELEYNKKKLIESIKGADKSKIFEKPKKDSLWKRIKKVLMGI